ncbi:Alpha/Beta hydrolase protein [Xylariales sp. AK1849]|nr:Alpha/Beta hydrolase protein [Xylariales sp. AK1849]
MQSLAILISGALGLASMGSARTVQIANGTVQGGQCNRIDSHYFHSIPYAQPPTGDLRFAAPQPLLESFGVLNATSAAPSCIQFNPLFGETGSQSEDCLFLDVWTPSSATPDSKLPVKVWLYGGINQAGGISDPTYDGCYSTTDSIVVSINYRVGPLGFLAVKSLGLSGNFGIMDQLMGLRWVQDNIAAFGGDPTEVLLFGQSAGAFDSFVLTTRPEAPELMKAAAMESGGGRDVVTVDQAQAQHMRFVNALNCSATDITCFRAASPSALADAVSSMPGDPAPACFTPFNNLGARTPWGPLVDGQFIPVSPSTVGTKVPAIFGSNTDEGTLFAFGAYGAAGLTLNQSAYDTFLSYNFGPLASKVNQTFPVDRFNGSYFEALQRILADVSYKCPAYRGLLKAQELGIPVWSYEFGHSPSCGWYGSIPASILKYVGAAHTAEIPFVFNTTQYMPLPNGNCTFSSQEKSLAASMSLAWTNMAAYGSPGDETVWPQFTASASAGVNIGDAMVAGTVDYSACAFWNEINEESIKIAGSKCYNFGNSTVAR